MLASNLLTQSGLQGISRQHSSDLQSEAMSMIREAVHKAEQLHPDDFYSIAFVQRVSALRAVCVHGDDSV